MIDNIELLAFIKENLALARTIVIKNEDVAILDNLAMLNYYGIKTPKDKAKWRYYLNLNGDYHETDDVMTVKSLDDSEMIPFTKAVLVDHPATKKAYRLGSYYFSRLAAKYPHQIDLIQGIINPIPPEESIPAKPYQILRYTKDYVHWNESQLIPALQEQINQIVYQSFNTEYKYTDDLMLPFLVAHLRESVFKFLLQCRFENRYSRHAHPFYIWSHLQSKGISPIYKDLLNNKQTMWLFRNIDWVLRNLGQTQTFKDLIGILLTERNIPLAKYDLVQSTEEMTTTLNPEPLFYSERLNLIETRGLGQTFNQIPHVMLKEIPESIDNELNYDKYLPTTIDESTYGLVTSYPIKVLDSELVDTTNRKPETFFKLLNNELIYLSGNDLYNINLDIEEPLSGIHQRVSVKDAVVLWHYLLNCYNGNTCENIPSFYYHKVLRIKPTTLSEFLSVGTKPFLTEEWGKDVLKTLIPQIKMVSPSSFYENALAIYNLKWTHKKMYSRFPSIGYHAHRKNAISTLYDSGFIRLTDKKTYSEFLEQYDFDFSHYQKDDYFSLMWEIWQKATGWDQFSHITVAQIQSGMIGLMRFLSSYSIQFIHQTTLEDGWFEGGLDLLTENPMLLNHDSENAPELELNVESARIPVHHRVVNRDLEQEEIFYGNAPFDSGTFEAELTEQGRIYETPRLYDVELDDTDKDNGAYSNQLIDLIQRYRPFTGTLPYDIEDLIPKGGEKYDQHTLKEMIVDTFEGIKKAGPWEAIGIRIPDNGLDNDNIADDVDEVTYDKIVETTSVDDETNQYFIGFSPRETGDHVIKLDIIIRHTETQEISYLRFDYNTVTKQKTWAISFEIPASVALNTPFEITPTITGLQLARASTVSERYYVYENIRDYLSIDESSGRLMGTFLQRGWPEELPVMYIMTTKEGDDLSSTHTYFMRGLIPSDRYYDPATDPDFVPVLMYNECDPNTLVLERFSIAHEKKGWVTQSVTFADTDNNKSLLKTDLNTFEGFLSPYLSQPVYQVTENDLVRDCYDYCYGVNKTGKLTLDLVVNLTNTESGETLTLTPSVKVTSVDHQFTQEFVFRDDTGDLKYPTGIESTFYTEFVGTEFTADQYDPTLYKCTMKDVDTVRIGINPEPMVGGEGDRFGVRKTILPMAMLEEDFNIAELVPFNVSRKLGSGNITLLVYGEVVVPKDQVLDISDFAVDDLVIKPWYPEDQYQYSCISQELIAKTTDNGWYVTNLKFKDDTKPDCLMTTFDGPPTEKSVVITDKNYPGIPNQIYLNQQDRDSWERYPEGYTTALGLDFLYAKQGEFGIKLVGEVKNKYSSRVAAREFDWTYDVTVNKTKNTCQLDRNTLNKSGGDVTIVFDNDHADAYQGGHAHYYTELGRAGYGLPVREGFEQLDGVEDHPEEAIVHYGPFNSRPVAGKGGINWYLFDQYTEYQHNDVVYPSPVQSFRNARIDVYPVVWTEDQILEVDVPSYDDVDFTMLPQPDFYKEVRSSLLSLVNIDKLTEGGWVVESIGLGVYGTDNQDAVMITTVDGVDLTSNMYIHGTQDIRANDTPEGKEDYAPLYVGFVPAKEGKQTIDLVVTLTNSEVPTAPKPTYTYQVDVEVNPKEGKITYDYTYPDPWWLVNESTYVLADVEEYSGYPNDRSMVLVTTREEFDDYISVGSDIRPGLASHPVIDLVAKQRFTDVTPRVIVGYGAYYGTYTDGDLRDMRNTRVYYGTLPVNPDRLYTLDEFTSDILNFKPDVVFDDMALNTVYTERYVYDKMARGWEPYIIRLQENQDWMAHVFSYDDDKHINGLLFANHVQNQPTDRQVKAPDGQLFYLPTYGSRKTGSYPVSIKIDMRTDHHEQDIINSVMYSTTREVDDTGIDLKLTYDELYIGKQNNLGGGLENVPESGLNENVERSSSGIQLLGQYAQYAQAESEPLMLTVAENYPEGDDHNIMVGYYEEYAAVKDTGQVTTATDFRMYRGEQVIKGTDIVEFVDYPTLEDFDFTPLGNVDFYQGVRSTAIVLYDNDTIANKGWDITDIKLAAYGAANQSDIILTTFDSKDLTNKAYGVSALSMVPSDTPDDKKAYKGYCFSFVPAKSGDQVFEVTVSLKDKIGKHTSEYTYELKLNVAEKKGEVRWDESDNDPWWLIGRETYYLTALYDAPSTLTSSKFESVALNDASAKLITAAIKTNSYLSTTPALAVLVSAKTTVDPNVIAIYNATFSGYADNDPRAVKYYFDPLAIKADHQYSLTDLDASVINFESDIVFEEMKVNQVYTERYTHSKAGSRGWEYVSIKPVEDTTWMAHVFEYGNVKKTTDQLFYYSSGQEADKSTAAPEGKYFFFPTYGSRKTGQYSMVVGITLSNKHFNGIVKTTVEKEISRKVVDSDFTLKLVYDELYIGRKTEIQGGMVNVPDTDVSSGLVASTTSMVAVGLNAMGITASANPFAVDIVQRYAPTTSTGFLLGVAVSYKEATGTTVDSETDYRAYRGEQIVPKEDVVSYVSFPKLEDLDFTPLANTTFYQGVRSTFITLYNSAAPNDTSWWVSKIDMDVIGTDAQDETIITSIDGRALGELAYKTDAYPAQISDAPVGKQSYYLIPIWFIPAKEGNQTFGVTFTVATQTDQGLRYKSYHFDMVIDVKAREGKVIYDTSESDPWWVIGKETFALTTLTEYTGSAVDSTLTYVSVSEENTKYMTARKGVNNALSGNIAMGVTVKDAFTDVTPEVIVGYDLTLNGYTSSDPRRTRIYFDKLPVNADHLYTLDDVTLDLIEFKPDVAFNNMGVNEAYTERYIYNKNSRGWSVKTIRLQENTDWMAHVFAYDNVTQTSEKLFSNNTQNRPYDRNTFAPDGKLYYLPRYGSRVMGEYDVDIVIILTNNHLSGGVTQTLTYTKKCNVIDSGVALKYTYDGVYIGRENQLSGGLTNVPTSDLSTAVVNGGDNTSLIVGTNSKYFKVNYLTSVLTVDKSYEEGAGNGIMLGVISSYSTQKSGTTVNSETEFRVYRGEQVIPEADITVKLEQPEDVDFDFTPLTSKLIKGVVCTIAYMYDANTINGKGWDCEDSGLTAYGTDDQNTVMIDMYEGKTFDDGYLYRYGKSNITPSDAPSYTSKYQYGYVTFIPANEGKQTIEVTIKAKHGSKVIPFSFPVEVDVSAKEGSIGYASANADPFFCLNVPVKLQTALSGYSGTLSKDTLTLAEMVARDESYFTVTFDAPYMTVTSIKDAGDIDRGIIVGQTVTVAGYSSGDKRAERTYLDVIWIDNTHVYSLDNLKPALIDIKADVVFEEMEKNTSYTERFSYLRASSSGWVVDSTKLVEDTSWMNHYFEYDGASTTTAQLFSPGAYKRTYDRNVNAPSDRWYSLPTYGSRKTGEFEVMLEVTISTTQFGRYQSGKFNFKQTRRVVEKGIDVTIGYDYLLTGQSNSVDVSVNNIPRPDLKDGVISSNTYYGKVGSVANYFTYNRNPTTIDISTSYPLGNGPGVMLTFVYPYSARRAGSSANSDTDNRAYRADFVIEDADIVPEPEYAMFFQKLAVSDTEIVFTYYLRHYGIDISTSAMVVKNGTTITINGVDYNETVVQKVKLSGGKTIPTFTLARDASMGDTFDWAIKGTINVFVGGEDDIVVPFRRKGTYK